MNKKKDICQFSEIEILKSLVSDPLSRHFVLSEREILALVHNICYDEPDLDWDITFDTLTVLEDVLSNKFSRKVVCVAFEWAYKIIRSSFYPAEFLFKRWVKILETDYIPIEKMLNEVRDLKTILEKIKALYRRYESDIYER